MVKITKEQKEIIKKYSKENNLSDEQVINYIISILNCPDCHISQSLGCIDFGDNFNLSCPDCKKPMVKEC